MLTEFFPDASQAEVREIIRRLLEENWIPVIAHAERIRACFADLAFSRDMIAQGALIQINAFSLEKESNTPIRLTARRLLANGLVHFIGSDAHRTTHRPPDVAAGAAHIRAHSMQAEDILHGNALRAFAAPAPHP